MESIKLTEEELKNLTQLKQTQENLVINLGELSYQVESLQIQKQQVINELKDLLEQQNDIGASLKAKYGDGTIDLNEGTFSKLQ